MNFLEKIERITEGRREHRGPSHPDLYPRGHMSRGSGPSTRHERLSGSVDRPGGAIDKRTVISPGTRSSGRGMRKGQVSYTRLTNEPRSKTHPGRDHGPLADVPASKPAPIRGRVEDAKKTVKKLGVAGAAKAGAERAKAAVKHAATTVKRKGKKAVGAVKRAAASVRGDS